MEIIFQILILILGFVFLIKGADWLVSGASSIASHFKVSKQLIGLTIVAIGTGAPELAVSISALATNNTDMLLGNVMGSNIINILLLIGIAAIIKPIRIKKSTVSKELPLLLLISTALVVLFLDINITGATSNDFSRSDAIVCILFFAIFIYYIVQTTRKNRKVKKEVEKPKHKLSKSFLMILIGLVGVVAGSQLVVNSASFVASSIGISERIISLTIIALGTSLPELVTTITAARRGEHDLLVGNIVGSNIFNICIVLGLPVAIFGTITPENFEIIDIVMLIGSAIILWIVTTTSKKITRTEGALMLVIFTIYYSYLVYGVLA
ncbi:calcium/sodium antiporter [Candidatus Saccharibacteria bacterium]|nr:calcium/sodium antiporter [Candidatus Saccharibacteria bacterium]